MECGIAVMWEPHLNICEYTLIMGCSVKEKVPVSQSPHFLSGEGCFNYSATLEEMLVALIVLVSITSSQMCILFFLIDCITLQVDDWVYFS